MITLYDRLFAAAFHWRLNKALPPRAKSRDAAKAEILAAAVIAVNAENLAEHDELKGAAGKAYLDDSTHAYRAFFNKVYTLGLPVGSGRIYACDRGGRLVFAAERLVRALLDEELPGDRTVTALQWVYPNIWAAAREAKQYINLPVSYPMYEQMLDEALERAVGEFEIGVPPLPQPAEAAEEKFEVVEETA